MLIHQSPRTIVYDLLIQHMSEGQGSCPRSPGTIVDVQLIQQMFG